METEHPDPERMHRLLGGALDDVEFESDVVPAVLTGYERHVHTRRYQAAGTALAVLAVTAASVTLLPRSGAEAGPGGIGPAASATTSKPPVLPGLSMDPAGCGHERWTQAYRGFGIAPAGTLSKDPEADRQNCVTLTAALLAVFPDLRVHPDYDAFLTLDPPVAPALPTQNRSGKPAGLLPDAGTEKLYLSTHPEDPANIFSLDSFTLQTASGREKVTIVQDPNPPGSPNGYAADCTASEPSGSTCTPIPAAEGWSGALHKSATPSPNNGLLRTAVLADGRGHRIDVIWNGKASGDWYQAGAYQPDGGASDPNHGKWINRWTGEMTTQIGGTRKPALTDEEWLRLVSSPQFHGYLTRYIAYEDKLPAAPSPTTTAQQTTPAPLR